MALETAKYGPASVMDILTFGYRRMFKNLKTITMFTLPLIFFGAIGSAMQSIFSAQMRSGTSSPDLVASISLIIGAIVSVVLLGYASYCITRYAADNFNAGQDTGSINESPISYLVPRQTLLGLILLGLLYFVALIPCVLIIGIGFMLLVLPGLAALCGLVYLYVRLGLVVMCYMSEPEKGVFASIGRSWQLTAGNFWRSFGLFLLVWIITLAILAPFIGMSTFGLQMLMIFQPAFVATPTFFVLAIAFFTISNWLQIVIGRAGSSFVLFRYYHDLVARQDPSVMAELASTPIVTPTDATWTPSATTWTPTDSSNNP